MVDVLLIGAGLLLVAGVIGSVVPAVPGPVLSIAGVYAYWISTGFAEPGVVLLTVLTLAGVAAVVVDLAGGPIAARLGGASTSTAVIAGVLGLLGLVVAGPIGLVIAVVTTAIGLEYRRHRDARAGVKAGTAALLGVVGSPVVQTLLTGTILVAMAAVAFL